MATSTKGTSSMVLSLPLSSPNALKGYQDLYGKRREMARVQMLEREISFLEEELKSSEGLQPASRCCKEITEFVVANSDPLTKKNRRSSRFWKWLCANHAITVVVVFHPSIAPYQSGIAALVKHHHIAVKRVVVAKNVVFSLLAILSGLLPLAAFANALALAQLSLRFTHVAAVQILVGTLAVHVASIVLPKKSKQKLYSK
ncbi:hypothetical protein VNO77_22932 [Canavalia gladiata]|uniref:G protein gamma domain-containing protein n=1 Tax=Canavalia gladiata TaxID=3824 RepID=A0AAN9L8S1_CANGL